MSYLDRCLAAGWDVPNGYNLRLCRACRSHPRWTRVWGGPGLPGSPGYPADQHTLAPNVLWRLNVFGLGEDELVVGQVSLQGELWAMLEVPV